jgi:hypothetical protein
MSSSGPHQVQAQLAQLLTHLTGILERSSPLGGGGSSEQHPSSTSTSNPRDPLALAHAANLNATAAHAILAQVQGWLEGTRAAKHRLVLQDGAGMNRMVLARARQVGGAVDESKRLVGEWRERLAECLELLQQALLLGSPLPLLDEGASQVERAEPMSR